MYIWLLFLSLLFSDVFKWSCTFIWRFITFVPSSILFSLFLSSINSTFGREVGFASIQHYPLARSLLHCVSQIQISLSSAEYFSRSVPIGLDVRRALKLGRRPGNCAKTVDYSLMHRSHDAEISGPAERSAEEAKNVCGMMEPQGPLLRPSHYRIRSSSKCESLVWKFLVGSLKKICRDTPISLASNIVRTQRVATCTCDLFDRWIYILTSRIRETVKAVDGRISHATILLEDRTFLKFYWL